MKINYGVTSKMGNYIKAAQANGETVFLITAKDETGFTCRTLDGKKTLDIFALEDGTPLLINHKILEVFDLSGATIKGSFRVAPLTISGPFGVQALVLPVRIDSEREQTFEAIAAATAEKYYGKNSD